MNDPCTPAIPGPDIGALRERFPGWRIEPAWVTAASGPDVRYLRASRSGVTLAAGTPAALAALIEAEQTGH